MIDDVAVQLAMRARALTLTVATTGTTTLAATVSGYTRTTGSFVTDGFFPGMEITPAGFATNAPRVVKAVAPLTITVEGALTAELAAAGRSLRVGLPSGRAWENVAFTPTSGAPWVEEHFIGGPSRQVTLGPLGDLEVEPQYALHINVPSATGLTARRYANALRTLFAPRTAIPLPNGDIVRVRSDTGPFLGDLQQGQPGFAVLPITFPLRIRTSNVI